MADGDQIDVQELAMLVRRLDRQRRAREAAEAIEVHATGALYDKQQHLRLLQGVAIAANESRSLDEALQAAVDQIGMQLGWPVGHAYLAIGVAPVLALGEIWYMTDLERHEPFRRVLESTTVAPRSSVAAMAMANKGPLIRNELDAVLPLPLSAAAREAGLQSVIAVPVGAPDAVVAVLEFFSAQPVESDEMLLEVLKKIGDLLGKVHARTLVGVTMRRSAEQYRLLFEGNANPMWIYDAGTYELIAVNETAVTHYGYPREELLKMSVQDLQPSGEPAYSPQDGRMHIRKKDGSVITAELSGYELRLPGRIGRITMAVDTDEGRRVADALRESERRFREMLDTIELAAVLLDIVGTVTYCNPFLLQLSGWSKDEVIGKNFFDLFLPEERRGAVARDFSRNIGRGAVAAHDEMEIVTRSGEKRVMLWNNTILRSAEGSVLGTASIGSDVTEQRAAEKQLLYNAFHDSLTGLPNRALFLDRVEHALSRVRREEWRNFAVLLLDVDHFKNVNDSLGHPAGDRLLIKIGDRLQCTVRAADTVARFGGDEFTILLENVDATDATRTATRIQQEIAAPFRVGENDLFTSASIGIIVAGKEYERAEQILRDADTAMYRAKAQGRARSEIFDATMRAEAVARLQMETDLRHAIERGELRVHYQPIVRLGSNEIAGYEALIRWQHPDRDLIPPAEFIPLAEETGLVVQIGQHVLNVACAQAVKWAPRYVAVNVSGLHITHGDLLGDVRGALAQSGLPASALHIEITESAIIQEPEAALELIRELRAIGCHVVLDDFGTGYSSLSYLHRFPIDGLKIDASFVREAPRERKNLEIIRSIIALGRGLAIDVVAEGIETQEQLELVRSLDCGVGQGFLFAKPGPAEAHE